MNLGGQLIWISSMEHLDHVWCLSKVFRRFPAFFIRCVVKVDKIEQPQALATMIKPAVKDLTDFPLIRLAQLNWCGGSMAQLGVSLVLVGCSSDTWKTG